MDYENGVIVKIYKSLVDTIIVGGACAAPKLRWTFPRDLVINDPPTHLRDNTEEGAPNYNLLILNCCDSWNLLNKNKTLKSSAPSVTKVQASGYCLQACTALHDIL